MSFFFNFVCCLLCVKYCENCSLVTFWLDRDVPQSRQRLGTQHCPSLASLTSIPSCLPPLANCLSPIAGPATAIKPCIFFQIYLKSCLGETSCFWMYYQLIVCHYITQTAFAIYIVLLFIMQYWYMCSIVCIPIIKSVVLNMERGILPWGISVLQIESSSYLSAQELWCHTTGLSHTDKPHTPGSVQKCFTF